jgi:hypothetical protein
MWIVRRVGPVGKICGGVLDDEPRLTAAQIRADARAVELLRAVCRKELGCSRRHRIAGRTVRVQATMAGGAGWWCV